MRRSTNANHPDLAAPELTGHFLPFFQTDRFEVSAHRLAMTKWQRFRIQDILELFTQLGIAVAHRIGLKSQD
jgi:hypothetical protein